MTTTAQKLWRKTPKGRASMKAAQVRYKAKLTPEQLRDLHRRQNDKRRPDQIAARRQWQRWNEEHRPAKRMFDHAKARAKKLGLQFNLSPGDITIPTLCPVLGIPLFRGTGRLHEGSPTLDRFVPVLGYVQGNVCVISHKANRIKTDATLLELEAVTSWMRNRK